jgi:hypothetical protein
MSSGLRVYRIIEHIAARLPFARRALRRRQQRRIVREIRQSGLFDTGYYFAHNPDVAASGTDLALHFATNGWKEGRKPSPGFDPQFYLSKYPDVAASGTNPLLHYVRSGREEGRQPAPGPYVPFVLPKDPKVQVGQPSPQAQRPAELLVQCFPHIFSRFPVFPSPERERRVTMLTDTISSGALFGGVGTGIVVAVLLAKKLGARLRIATRMEMRTPSNFEMVIKAQGITWDENVEFLQCSDTARPMPMGSDEIVLTTSWWGTASALRTIDAKRIFYLIQEDERRFYPYGDERLWCSEVMNDARLRFLVNTHTLHEYFGAEGFKTIAEHGVAFEPAFPETLYWPDCEEDVSILCAAPPSPKSILPRLGSDFGGDRTRRTFAKSVGLPLYWEQCSPHQFTAWC